MITRLGQPKRLSARARLFLVAAICFATVAGGTFGWVHATQASGNRNIPVVGRPHIPGGVACHTWTIMSSPNVAGTVGDVLAGVAVVSRANVWAAGWSVTSISSTYTYTAMMEHWSGSAWSLITIPLPPQAIASELNGIAAASANDIWAVGEYLPNQPRYWATLIEHFDGNAWTIVQSANAGSDIDPTSNHLQAVTIDGTEVWAVGYLGDSGGQTLAEKWDGQAWSVIPSVNPGSNNVLLGVTASPDGTVWAVGKQTVPPDSVFQTLIEHWNGTTWQAIPSANINGTFQYQNQLLGVTPVAANDLWAVGNYTNSTYTNPQVPYFEHWNGTEWSLVPSGPIPAFAHQSVLTSVTRFIAGSSLLIATGSMSTSTQTSGESLTLAQQWNGSAWTSMLIQTPVGYWASPRLLASGSDLAGDVFAVGTTYTGLNTPDSQTLIEYYAPSPC